MKPDLSGCQVLTDGEGVTLESGKPFTFACCDCGLTHRVAIVSEDGRPVGFAVERDDAATAKVRNLNSTDGVAPASTASALDVTKE